MGMRCKLGWVLMGRKGAAKARTVSYTLEPHLGGTEFLSKGSGFSRCSKRERAGAGREKFSLRK